MKTRLKVINNEKEHRKALATIEALWNSKPGSKAHDTMEVLALLIDEYERRTFPMPDPDPVEAIRFRMEQLGLEQKDLVPILGSRSRVSEVLKRKRTLTLDMIRKLFDELHIPLEVLVSRGA